MKTRAYVLPALCLSIITFLTGCAEFTYQAEEWRVAIVDNDHADVTVRYIGIGADTTDAETRAADADKLKRLATDDVTGDIITPGLHNARQKLITDNNLLILEESGTMRNPLSWFAQTGFDPRTWWNYPVDLSESGTTIIKTDIDQDRQILATNGRVTDESTYRTLQVQGLPFEFGADMEWQREDAMSVDSDIQGFDELQVIVWPDQTRMFYWKISGPAFNATWQSLMPEYAGDTTPVSGSPENAGGAGDNTDHTPSSDE